MYDRIAAIAHVFSASYHAGYDGWRFNGSRSVQLATSDRQIIGGIAQRCSLLSRG